MACPRGTGGTCPTQFDSGPFFLNHLNLKRFFRGGGGGGVGGDVISKPVFVFICIFRCKI